MRREEMISSERYCSSCGAANAQDAESCFACGLSLKITLPLPLEPISSNSLHLLQERYRILAQVGKGGFSAVYKAVDTLFNEHPVASKAITLSGLKPQEVIEATEAFNREMLVLSGLKHPNLPRIYNHFSDTECWYLAMDFIEGSTLEKHLEKMLEARLPVGEALEIGLMLCSVLEYLHNRQPAIIFRDLKPANVMLRPDGRIALHFKPGQARDTMPFGSPGYAAPEQYGKAQTTPRTDIYGLGVMLHQLLTGDDPSQSPFRFAPLQLQDQPALAGLEPLIMQMVEMDAAKRPESVVAVKQELQRIAHAWSMQYMYGLQAYDVQGAQAGYRPASTRPLSWQTIVPAAGGIAQGTGTTVAARGGQMIILQQPGSRMGTGWSISPPASSASSASARARGGGGAGARYWAMGAPQKRRNAMAIASLVFGIISILTPFASCPLSITMASHFGSAGFRLFYILPAVILITPPVLAVVFGHIGKRRANTVPGMGTSDGFAIAGLTLGYIFGSIYLLAICTILTLFVR